MTHQQSIFTAFFSGISILVSNFTPLQWKFAIIAILVPFVALYMRSKDENKKTASFYDSIMTVVISILFVWFGYELAIWSKMPTILALIISFFIGVYSLKLVVEIGKHLISNIGVIVKAVFDRIKKMIE